MAKQEFPLSAPIQAHGEQVSVLNVRRPTPEEMRAIRVLPYTLTESNMPNPDMEAVAKYIAVCAGIPPTSVNQLELYDLNQLAWTIIGFFLNAVSKPPAT
jgi:hypothetical protein